MVTTATRVAAAGLSYAIFIAAARGSSPEVYNQFALIVSLISFLGPIAPLGQVQVASKYFPGLWRDRRWGVFAAVLRRNALIVFFGAAAAALLAVIFLAYGRHTPLPLALLVALGVFVVGVAEYAFAFSKSFASVVWSVGLREISWRAVFLVVVLGWTFLIGRLDIWVLTALYCVCQLVSCLALLGQGALVLRRAAPDLARTPPEPLAARGRLEDWYFFGLVALNIAYVSGDVIILNLAGQAAASGAYFSAQRSIQLLYFLLGSAIVLQLPRAAQLEYAGDRAGLARLSQSIAWRATLQVAPLALIMAMLAQPILGLFNPAFVRDAPILMVLALAPLIQAAGGLQGSLPELCGLERTYFIIRLSLFAVFLALKWWAATSGNLIMFALCYVGEMAAITGAGVLLCNLRLGVWCAPAPMLRGGFLKWGTK